jgi:hypothetical protein
MNWKSDIVADNHHRKNPKGISAFSPALTRSGYAGWRHKMASTLKELNCCARNGDATALRLENILGRLTQGSAAAQPWA